MTKTALVLVLALFLGGCAKERGRATGSEAPAAADSLAALEPYAAYQRGLALGQAQRFDESLPYFRRALEVPPQSWQPYCDFAISLFHATHQARAGLGAPRPVTRSSYERVRMMREALALLDRAEVMTQTPGERAYVVALRARYCRVWGLQWDALAEYHRAGSMDTRHLAQAFELADVMRNPTTAAALEPQATAPALQPQAPASRTAAPTTPRVIAPTQRPAAPPPPPTPTPAPVDTAASPAEPDTSNGE